jgi:hypothetical protein
MLVGVARQRSMKLSQIRVTLKEIGVSPIKALDRKRHASCKILARAFR